VHRDQAGISPFDSSVQGGDAVWEGLRLYDGRIFKLIEHLDRLRGSAVALAFAEIPSHEQIIEEIRRTLAANQMRDGVHIRLTLTRGVKLTSGMDPRLNVFGPTLIVLAEHKPPVYDKSGITLVTASVRRFSADCLDPKIHHNNLIQSILAKIEANVAGADDALMLDTRGFVAETNATHVFLVDRGRVFTPRVVACPEGITRATVLELCRQHGIPCEERDVSLAEVYRADEMFCTGTMGELAPVTKVDGRVLGRMHVQPGNSATAASSATAAGSAAAGSAAAGSAAAGSAGPMTRRLSELFSQLTKTEGYPILAGGSP
jgi:branched-chain amino acid aminotransferase